jgi:hypothetical protein
MTNKYAVTNKETGMLIGVGYTEDAAWEDAKQESILGNFELNKNEYICKKASKGLAYDGIMRGGILVAQLVLE